VSDTLEVNGVAYFSNFAIVVNKIVDEEWVKEGFFKNF